MGNGNSSELNTGQSWRMESLFSGFGLGMGQQDMTKNLLILWTRLWSGWTHGSVSLGMHLRS